MEFRRGRPTAFICVVDMNDLSFLMPFLNNLTILLCMCDFTCCTDFRAPQPPRICYTRICRRDFVCALLPARCCRRAIILRVFVYEPILLLYFSTTAPLFDYLLKTRLFCCFKTKTCFPKKNICFKASAHL